MENFARVGRKFELDQIQANSIQLKPSGWPNDTQLHRSCELGSSWLVLGGPFGQGLESVRGCRFTDANFVAARMSLAQGNLPWF